MPHAFITYLDILSHHHVISVVMSSYFVDFIKACVNLGAEKLCDFSDRVLVY